MKTCMKKWTIILVAHLASSIAIAQESTPVIKPINRTIWGSPWFWTLIAALLVMVIALIQSLLDQKADKTQKKFSKFIEDTRY
jgi:hypothetical protein